MKRKLLIQTLNEWRINLWLAVELLVVSVVLWYVIDGVFAQLTVYYEPLGFDISHCYKIDFELLNENSPDYDPSITDDDNSEALVTLLKRIQARPEIEAAAFGINSHMYNGNNNSSILYIDSLSTGNEFVVHRWVSPDFPIVFRYHGDNGETPEQLAKTLAENPNVFFASGNILSLKDGDKMENYVGRTFENHTNGPTELVLGGILEPVKYYEFSPKSSDLSIMSPLKEDFYDFASELVVRVKDNMDHDFIANLMDDAQKNLRVGNYYVYGVESFDDIRESFLRARFNNLRDYLTAMAFLALNIFLGLLGTFWFRTQQRVKEIAMRRVNGATRRNIFCRMMGEGLLLLTCITPIAIGIDYLLTQYELNVYLDGFFVPYRFAVSALGAYLLVALMIVLGIMFPAMRAMRIQPAEALKEE